MKAYLFLVQFVLFVTTSVRSSRILAVLPIFASSHHVMYQSILCTLARAGHQVVVYTSILHHKPPTNYTQVYLEPPTAIDCKVDNRILELTKSPHWKGSTIMFNAPQEYWLQNIMMIKPLLSPDVKFDLVITEALVGQECFLIFGQLFNAPTISLQAFHTNTLVNKVSGNALSISYIPDIGLPYSNRMSLFERIVNSFTTLRGLYMYYNYYIPKAEQHMRQYFPNMPPLLDMINNISMTFTNSHVSTYYSQPHSPNIIPVGGIHLQTASETVLPQDIKRFMDAAEDGVIYFSLGTYVPDDLMPQGYFDMLVNVFKNLPQRVLWKTRKENITGLPKNIMTATWMPQQAILAHPRCVLFITHGGLLSQHETIHFGVPVVGVPFFFDQPRNVKFYEHSGMGVYLDYNSLSETTLFTAVQTVLNDPKYRENAQRLSQVFRDRPMTPAETVVYWTEYVLRHGGAAHLKPTAAQLSWYKLALLDVLAVIFAIIVALITTLYLGVKQVIVMLRVNKLTVKTTKKDK